MKTKLLIGGGVVAALLGTALIVPSFIDWNKYKGPIVTQLEAATGHDYDIQGPIQLAILPFPHVSVDALSVKAPADQGGASLLTLDKASVSVELLPLIQGQVNVKSVTLDKPVITVAIAQDGTPSWITPKLQARQSGTPETAQGQASQVGMADKIAFQSIRIKNGSIQFEDQRSGKVIAARDINLTVQAGSLFGPYDVDGDLAYQYTAKNAREPQLETIEIEGKSGRIGKDAGSARVNVEVRLPSSKSNIEFSGTAGLRNSLEVQGEATLATDNLARLIEPFTGPAPAAAAMAVQAKGILTYTPNSVALRNARFSYGNAPFEGSIAISGLKQAPMTVEAELSSDKPVNLDKLIPAKDRNEQGGGEGSSSGAAASLIPETLIIPSGLTGKVAVALKTVTYKGLGFNDTVFNVAVAPKTFKGQFRSGLAGDGDASGTFDLTYASAAEKDGSMILSDPSLNYRMQLNTKDPRRLLGAFVPPANLDKAGNLLASNLGLDVKGTVTPRAVKADAGSLTLLGTPFAFAASYTPKAMKGRDSIVLTVSADTLDADAWLKRVSPDRGQEAATRPENKKPDVAAMAKSFSLPFDLDLSASVKSLRYKENDYANVGIKGKMAGNSLAVQQAGFQDQSGNVLNVAGNIASLTDLKGIDLSANGRTPDADLLLKTLKVDAASLPDKVGSAEGSVELKGQADHLGFTANIKALRGSLEASGALADLLTTPSVSDLTFRLRHPNYVDLVRLYDPTFRGSVDIDKNLDLFTSMQRDGKVYKFKEIRAAIGPARITGEMTADMGGSVPFVSATMQFGTFPVDKLLGAEATTGRSGTIQAGRSQPSGDVRWSRDAIDTAWMRKWNADFKTTADQVSYGNWQIANADMAVTLKNGTLTLDKLNGGMYGGTVGLTGKMASSAQERQPLDVSAAVNLDGVSLESFVQSFSGSRLVRAKGTINLDTNVNATGISPAALIFDLAGKGTVKGNDLELQGFDLARISRTFVQPSSSWKENFGGLLNSSLSGGSTRFDTLDGAFTISEGVINFDRMKLNGEDASIDTAGTVSLPLWTVNIENTITLPEPKDNPPPPLKVAFKGPLDNPAQTFGKSALEGYFMQQYGNKLQDKLIEKLDKKGGALGEAGRALLPGLFGGEAQQQAPVANPAQTQTAPEAQQNPEMIEPAAQPASPADPVAQPQPQAAPASQPAPEAQPQAESKPEDQIKDLLKGMIGR